MIKLIKYRDKTFVCALDLGFDLIKGKWKAVILCHLSQGPKRFLELQRITHGVSQKILTERLRDLEEDGLIERIISPEIPPKVEYILTAKGEDLCPALDLIEKWSKKNFVAIDHDLL
ncbi:MAG: putative transcriptional regulator [Firmicutes bacterium]|nr:putative transcriptional regulator [Bacillota bacterium]